MEACIWGDLPEHLLEQIVARLPIATLLRCRSLSTKWRCFISSLRHRHPPCFLLFANHAYHEAFTFDSSSLSWFCLPFPSFSVGDERHIPVASAGGLVCFTSSLDGHKTFTVCNPVTRSWRKLPPMLNPFSFLETVGMVILDDSCTACSPAGLGFQQSAYKVIVAGNHDMSEDTIFTEVFDSTTDKWETTSTMPRGADPMLSAVACNGTLYSWCCEPDGLLSYDLKHHSWDLLPTSTPHSTLVSNAIISWQGRLFMLGGLNENQITTTVSVWELICGVSSSSRPAKHTKWVLLDTMPPSLLHEFLGGRTFFMCVGCEGLVLLHLGGCSQDMPMLLYDIAKKSWQRVLVFPLLEDREEDGLIDGIAFTPHLCATP